MQIHAFEFTKNSVGNRWCWAQLQRSFICFIFTTRNFSHYFNSRNWSDNGFILRFVDFKKFKKKNQNESRSIVNYHEAFLLAIKKTSILNIFINFYSLNNLLLFIPHFHLSFHSIYPSPFLKIFFSEFSWIINEIIRKNLWRKIFLRFSSFCFHVKAIYSW